MAFPLGGIGTGSISLGGNGRLRDFEIFNRPAKGQDFDYTFLTLHVRPESGSAVTRVLQGPLAGHGLSDDPLAERIRRSGIGLPHFREAEFVGRFPFAEVRYLDPTFPIDASLEAFSPFIPLNADDTGLPVAWLVVKLANPLAVSVDVALYATLQNRLGEPLVGGGVVEFMDIGKAQGLRMSSTRHGPDSPNHGTLVLATTHTDVAVQTSWEPGSWFASLRDFWDQVAGDAFVERRETSRRDDGCDVGTIRLKATIPAGGSVRLPIWFIWHVPNFEKYWGGSDDPTHGQTWRNHYAVRFRDAQAVAGYVADHANRLERETRMFADALWASTLPDPVLDAITSQLSTLRTSTCLRLEDGTFWAWEGCNADRGSCDGTCSHVWNYAQALPYLFPSLERSIHEAAFENTLHPDGHMTFRLPLPLGTRPPPAFHAAADGQLGAVLRTYRDWRITGDDRWLRDTWPKVRQSLEYAWKAWDRDRDGVVEGLQHNTYDIEFFGPNPMVETLYLAALEAAAKLSERLGEADFAEECRDLRRRGAAWTDAHLFNGEYYEQEIRPEAGLDAAFPPTRMPPGASGQPPHQVGTGCLSDQLIGQWYAFMLDLGPLLTPGNLITAARSIFLQNWRRQLWDHVNAQRIFAHEDEAGLVLASWPRGHRPEVPFPYCDEVWTGIEYEVAALFAYLGLKDEALAVVSGCRARYTGARRNPWSDIECGDHYARGMAAYGLLLAWSGFRYSAPDASLSFHPLLDDDPFEAFFCVESGWGTLRRAVSGRPATASITVRSGILRLQQLDVPLGAVSGVALGLMSLDPAIMPMPGGSTRLRFAQPVDVSPGNPLVATSA